MIRSRNLSAFLGCFIVVVASSGHGLALPGKPQSLPLTTLNIESAAAGANQFQVEVATAPDVRAIGLMFRTSLADDRGMLFDFGAEQYVSFWMKNTYIPLDLLFIDANGVILQIAAQTTPLSLDSIRSNQPVRGVLEIRGGLAGEIGIREGDRVIHGIFDHLPDQN